MERNRRRLLTLSGAMLASLSGCLGDDGREETEDRSDGRAGSDGEGNGSSSDGSTPNGSVSNGSAAGTDEDGRPVPNASDDRVEPDVSSGEIDALVEGQTAFALRLYDRFRRDDPSANRILSPFSIQVALAMTWAGARGETEIEMAEALSLSLDQDRLHPAVNALSRDLEGRSAPDDATDGPDGETADPPELAVANALWPRKGLALREAYLDIVVDHYGVDPVTLDYGDPAEASRIINEWVASETDDRITDLVAEESLGPDTALVLTNAIYFEASWESAFDEADTADATFTPLEGSPSEVAMMSQAERFPYASVEGHQLVELPYAGGRTSMVVVLPAEGEFEAFEDELDGDRLAELLDALESQHGRVELPRFELETSASLVTLLQALGMEEAFTGEADFSGMVEGGGLFISDVLHDAVVTVDETGTEAAAATAVVMNESGPPPAQFELTADRPFLFVLRDRPTGSVSFLGRVVDVPDDPGE